MTVIEIAEKLLCVQNILDSLEVKGYTNASSVSKAYDLCSEILLELKKTIIELQNESKEEGVNNGESN